MVIVYGGSFNPPTIAHFKIAQKLIEKYNPEAFIFLPVGNIYKKEKLVDFYHRYNMLGFMANQLKNTYISGFENEMKVFKGTINSLKHFKDLYPRDEIFYVIGADNLKSLDKWIDYQFMIKNYKFIILNRNFINIEEIINNHPFFVQYKNHFYIETDFETIDISSTDYRESLNDKVVIDEINQYIYDNNLYNRGGK